MSRLAIPVSGRPLHATGDVMLSAWLSVDLRDGSGNFTAYDFRVDTGSEITTFPAHEAKRLGLHVPQRPANIRHEQTGLEVRSGMLAFRIIGMDQTLYAVLCFLLGDPNAPPPPGTPRGQLPRNLLQPFHLLDALKFSTDKDPASIGAPQGEFIIEKR